MAGGSQDYLLIIYIIHCDIYILYILYIIISYLIYITYYNYTLYHICYFIILKVDAGSQDYLLYTSFLRETTAKGRTYPGIECLKSIDKFAALSSWYKLPSDLTTITAGLQFYSCSQIMFYNNDNDLSGI